MIYDSLIRTNIITDYARFKITYKLMRKFLDWHQRHSLNNNVLALTIPITLFLLVW